MKYPIKTDVFIKAAETQLGPVNDTVKKLFSLYIDEVNRAYRQGVRRGQAEVTDFRDKVVNRLGELCSWNDFNTLCLIDIVEHIDDILEEVQEKWSDEHPQETMVEHFYKLFPNAQRNEIGQPKYICPANLGWVNKCVGTRDKWISCEDCWNRPYIEGGADNG